MTAIPQNRHSGFSLIELTVALLIVVLLAGIALRSTNELSFQVRYEQTQERLQRIKEAIIGNPSRTVNGQPDISGFVADMGRLPDNLRELLERGACSNPSIVRPSLCVSPVNWSWLAGQHYNVDAGSGLGYGWRGPYLDVSGNADGSDAFTDGWGNTSADGNYGWRGFPPNPNDLTVTSYGKDQQAGPVGGNCGSGYDADCNVQIRQADYQMALTALNVTINMPDNGTCQVAAGGGACSNPSYVTEATCEEPRATWASCSDSTYTTELECNAHGGSWLPGTCSIATYTAQGTCTAPKGTWVLAHCSDPLYTDQATCEMPRATWHLDSCSDPAYTTQAACEAPKAVWDGGTASCSDPTYLTQAECEAPREIWTPAYCSNSLYSSEAECTTPRGVWTADQCSDAAYTNQTDCEAPKATWTAAAQGVCSDPQYSASATCTAPHGDWVVPAANSGKYYCGQYAGTWQGTTHHLCAVVYHRDNGAIVPIASDPLDVQENGGLMQVPFTFPAGTRVNNGINAIGIYEHDGTNCTNTLYPSDRQQPIQVLFNAHSSLPVINW